jgi:hypothetical protein
MSKLFEIGDILRYDNGCTALMRVSYVSKGHGGSVARYYGQQCMGGSCGAYHEKVIAANHFDSQTWFEHGRRKDVFGRPLRTPWRRFKKGDSNIVGAVED